MKRLLSTLALAGLLFSLVPSASAEFSDLSATDPHYVSVSSLVTQSVLQGYSDGTFKPDQEVNRAEALKIILIGTGVRVDSTSAAGLLFSDVAQADWFSGYIGTAVTKGIVQGYNDGTFKPEQTVTRAEAMKMLTLAAGVTVPDAADSYADVTLEDWFASYASYSKQWNIEAPQTDGLWHGGDAVSRGDLSEMVYRLQTVKANGGSFDESTNWLRTSFDTVDVSMKVPFGWGTKTDGVGAAFLLDSANGQMSLLTPYDNGGTLLMTRYANAEQLGVTELFDSIRAHTSLVISETSFGGNEALVIEHNDATTYREWYIYLPNHSLVNLVALRGQGAYEKYLEWYFNAMVSSLEYVSTTNTDLTVDEVVQQLRTAIEVDSAGKQMMDLLTDWDLIETDSIGVGTGPVDYYYSPSVNVTVKYERSFDVLLDIRDGQTSAF
jgi:hypothetical protein